MRRRIAVLFLLVAAGCAVALVLTSGGGRAAHGGARGPRARAGPPSRPVARPPRPRIVSGPHRAPVPILMYHVISDPQPGAPYPELYTPAPVFAAQMRALARRGYHAVTLRAIDDYWRRGWTLPPHPIVISFDDG